MSSVNLFTREISVKIVYYGPGLGGKTSSLQYVHRALKPEARGQLVSLSTGVDRTLYFDFLPVQLPKLRGYSVRVQLYTVPGQVHYNSTRKLVLAGADGLVFVADSQPGRETANVESLENLRENLAEQGVKPDAVPQVFQWNKRDMEDVLSVSHLAEQLNPEGAPAFETVATSGRGVFEALKAITTLVLDDLKKRGIWDGGVSAEVRGPAVDFGRPGDSTLADRVQALSDGDVAAAALHLDGPGHAPPDPAARRATSPGLSPVHPAMRFSGAPPVGAEVPAVHGLSELVPTGPSRDQVVAAQAAIARADYAEAVRIAGRGFAEGSRAEGGSPDVAPVLHALMLGLPGKRYLRFCEAAARAEQGSASAEDALYALFFLVDTILDR